MTPDDVKSQRFTTRFFGGVSPEEVTAFLEDVAEAFGEVQKVNTSLTARVKELEGEIPAPSHIEVLRTVALREVEALLHDAQAQAQTVIGGAQEREAATLREAEATRARLQIEAEEIVAGATTRAASLVDAAREQEAAIRSEIDSLAQSHQQLVDSVRTTLETYHQWLATVDPRGRARGRREALEVSTAGGNGAGPDEAKAG